MKFAFVLILLVVGVVTKQASGYRREAEYEDLLQERIDEERKHRDLEKLFEEVEERKNHHKVWPREDKEEEEEDFYDNNIDEDEDDDYEYNGEHKSDLDENIIRAAEEEFKNDRDTNKKAIEKKQVTKLTTSTPTTLPKTTHRPTTTKKRIPTTTATGSSTRRLINSSHRHRLQPEQFRYHRRYHYRHPLVRTFHRGNNQRFTLSRQEDSTGGFYRRQCYNLICLKRNKRVCVCKD